MMGFGKRLLKGSMPHVASPKPKKVAHKAPMPGHGGHPGTPPVAALKNGPLKQVGRTNKLKSSVKPDRFWDKTPIGYKPPKRTVRSRIARHL